MWSPRHRMQMAFDFETMDVPLNPVTYKDHLVFATNYQLSMYRLGSSKKREEARPHVTAAMMRYSLPELRALFLFALEEHRQEIDRKRRLHELERAALWIVLVADGYIELPKYGGPPVATPRGNAVRYESSIELPSDKKNN